MDLLKNRIQIVSSLSFGRRCWAEIDLSALAENLESLRQHAGTDTRILAVVKANAYGHGLEEIAEALFSLNIRGFGVANVTEALRVLDACDVQSLQNRPYIFVLSPVLPEEIETALSNDFICSVSSEEEVKIYSTWAKELGKTAQLHAVVDTGMGRMGCLPEQLSGLVGSIQTSPNCQLVGIASHFPSADEDENFTRGQIQKFQHLTKELSAIGEAEMHLANSAGLLDFSHETQFAHFSRVGLALYGISPECRTQLASLRPVMTLKSRVILVREVPQGTTISYGGTFVADQPMKVATIAVGYGDGFPRRLSGNHAEVLIGGQRCAVLGRVTMDQTVVDVSALPGVSVGDEVTLFGASQQNEVISATEIAAKAETIPWEILTGITPRVERIYANT